MAEINYIRARSLDSADRSADAVDLAEDGRPLIEQWGLRNRRPPKSLPPIASDELSSMYFEVYRVPETHLTAILRSGGDWRWRFCTSDGCVEAT
ncbi:MAG: hypothetical protein ABW128_19600, partial [Rhizorhabdus sp.]